MKRYVVGFAFSENKSYAALVRKNRPDWQAGCLNGIGGKIEEGELPFLAMEREFFEETGVRTLDWQPFVHLVREGVYEVFIYVAFTDAIWAAMTLTDEEILIKRIDEIFHDRYINNLSWLIPMALDPYVGKGQFIRIEDTGGN